MEGPGDGSGALDPQVGSAIRSERGRGTTLPTQVLQRMGSAFDADFSQVSVHTDDRADQLSRSVNARAFTTGQDVFFSRGSYDPGSSSGQELIAHELTHVVQNRAGASGGPSRVSHPDDAAEVEARRVARLVVSTPTGAVDRVRQAADGEVEEVGRSTVLREDAEPVSDITTLDSMLDAFDTPEDQVIALVTAMSASDKATVAAGYKGRIANAMNIGEMLQVVRALPLPLVERLEWVSEAALTDRLIDYEELRSLVLGADQGQRDALNTPEWQAFFVRVCTNASIVDAVQELGFPLAVRLRWAIDEGGSYESFSTIIRMAPDREVVLADQPLLRSLLAELTFDEFAKCMELLGRTIPNGATILADPAVQSAISSAWADSDVAITPGGTAPPGQKAHEEGGFVYLDLITNVISTSRVTRGAAASIPLNDTAEPDGSITVAGFHTHPNVGPAWGAPFFSPADVSWAARNGIPILMRGAYPDVASTSDHVTGPDRLHLAGSTGRPGAAGGSAPQATLEDDEEEP